MKKSVLFILVTFETMYHRQALDFDDDDDVDVVCYCTLVIESFVEIECFEIGMKLNQVAIHLLCFVYYLHLKNCYLLLGLINDLDLAVVVVEMIAVDIDVVVLVAVVVVYLPGK